VRRVVVVAVVVRRRDSRLAEATAEADVEVEIEAIAGTSAARRDQQRLGTLETVGVPGTRWRSNAAMGVSLEPCAPREIKAVVAPLLKRWPLNAA
jgi:hypothetical protein